MKDKNWFAPTVLPEISKDFIEEIIIEYENDLGTFHAIGLFTMDVDIPVFLEVLTGTKINWNKTVKRWRFFQMNSTIPFAIHSAIVDALDHAKNKHPHFADTDTEAGVVIAEELLEVNDAGLRVMQDINDQVSKDNLFIELAQLNATTIRMMEKLLNK